MEELLKIAKNKGVSAEVYALKQVSDNFSFENGEFKNIESSKSSGVSLRIIKDGMLGFAYTRNLKNTEELFNNAILGVREKVEAHFEFPFTDKVENIRTYDEKLEEIKNEEIVEECERVINELKKRVKGQINIFSFKSSSEINILNTSGTNLRSKRTEFIIHIHINFPNTYAGIERMLLSRSFKMVDEDIIQFVSSLYNAGENVVHTKGGRMKVLFLPETMFVLLWRLLSGSNGMSLYLKETPLIGKIGERIFSEKLSIYNDPLNEDFVYSTPFDDEGVPCRRFPIVEKGVFKNFFFDLYYAGKTGNRSTGNGFRSGFWGGDPIRIKPIPMLTSIYIEKGDRSFDELIRMMDRGIIVAGQLGAHSGNIPNGDFSIGLSPGIYVEDGKIKGRVLDAMVSGNIYEVMKDVIGVEDKVYPSFLGYYPSILFDNVSVAMK